MRGAIFALTFLCALPVLAQAPPPLLDELPDDRVEDPDNDPPDPVVEEPAEPGAGDEFFEAPEPEPSPEPDPPSRAQRDVRWNGGTTFLINTLAGVGVFCVAGFVPGGYCMAPAAAGLAQATLGDKYSDRRGAFAPPVIVNYLVTGVGFTGVVMSYFFVLSGGFQDPPLAISLIVGSLVFAVVAPSMASAATYWLLSEPKSAGDDGGGQPGAFTPAHRDIQANATPVPTSSRAAVAMRF